MTPEYAVERFIVAHTDALVALWQECGLTKPWNDPHKDIERKLKDPVGGLFVVCDKASVVASVMLGYDGHRGSVYYLAVHPAYQGQGLGRLLMNYCETFLLALECPKINLYVRDSNLKVMEFYDHLDYAVDPSVVLGKRLIADH